MLNFIVEHLSEISNFSMAIATVIMALYSKKSIDEMKISRKEANKANIVFYVELKERHLNFVIKNTGKTTAYDVKIRSNPKFRACLVLVNLSKIDKSPRIVKDDDITNIFISAFILLK